MVIALLACERVEPTSPCADAVVAGVPGAAGRGADGLPADETWLFLPQDVTVAVDGTFWVVDYNNHLLREVGADGIARVVAGSGFPSGGDGGPALTEPLDHPTTALPDPEDPARLWFTATGNHRIGLLDRDRGWIEFPYGTGLEGFSGDGGPASEAWFWRPSSLAFDAAGATYVSDRMNQVVRRISDGGIETVVGTPGVAGYSGDGGPAIEATLNAPAATETDPGNRLDVAGDRLVLADTGNHVVREVDLASGVITTLADGFVEPHDVAIAADGTVYVADTGNQRVAAIDGDGGVTTVADGFAAPVGVAVGPDGAVWVADRDEHVIWRFCAVRPGA